MPIIVSTTPPRHASKYAPDSVVLAVSVIELEDSLRVLAEELGPHVIAEWHARKLAEDPIQREAHGEVARVHHLVGPARVGVVDDVGRIELRREGRGGIVQVRPLEHEFHREVCPWFAAMTRDELELREEPAHLVDEGDVLTGERNARSRDPGANAD